MNLKKEYETLMSVKGKIEKLIEDHGDKMTQIRLTNISCELERVLIDFRIELGEYECEE